MIYFSQIKVLSVLTVDLFNVFDLSINQSNEVELATQTLKKVWGWKDVFKIRLLFSPRVHLFDQKNQNTAKKIL